VTGPETLTDRQLQCMRLIQDYTDASGGSAPTVAQLAAALDLKSKSGAHRLISGLVERGYIERGFARSRSLRILHRLPPPVHVAVLTGLAEIMAASVPSADGMVRIILPKATVDAAIAAIGVKAA
jgi:SOS-response transcriptional repressor LexA